MFLKREDPSTYLNFSHQTAIVITAFISILGINTVLAQQTPPTPIRPTGSQGFSPIDAASDIAIPGILPNTSKYLVNPNSQQNFYFGKWEISANGRPVAQALPSGLTGSNALQDVGFYQRNIEDPTTGERYIQQIVTDAAVAGETFSKVGMFSESYVKTNGQNSGVSVLQGMNCGKHNGKCLAPDEGVYMNGQAATSIEFLNKIRTGAFEDPKEKVRLKQLIYETDDPLKWADSSRNTTGTTFYTDIWRGSYDYKGVELGDFVNTVIKSLDIDPLYSYIVVTAEMRFDYDDRDLEIAQRETIDIGPDPKENAKVYLLSEAEKLRNNFSSSFGSGRDGLIKARDYIQNYIQYRAITQEGWHTPNAGLARYEMFQSEMVGAMVKAGNIEYEKKYKGNTIVASWSDGQKVNAYGTNQDMGFQQQGHEQVTPDTCDDETKFDSDERTKCGAEVRYEFATTDVYKLIKEPRIYDPRVGDQFKIEIGKDKDIINPFDPFSTVAHLPVPTVPTPAPTPAP